MRKPGGAASGLLSFWSAGVLPSLPLPTGNMSASGMRMMKQGWEFWLCPSFWEVRVPSADPPVTLTPTQLRAPQS